MNNIENKSLNKKKVLQHISENLIGSGSTINFSTRPLKDLSLGVVLIVLQHC